VHAQVCKGALNWMGGQSCFNAALEKPRLLTSFASAQEQLSYVQNISRRDASLST